MNLVLIGLKIFKIEEILNSGIYPEWSLLCSYPVLEPAYTGEGKQFFSTQDIIYARKSFHSFNKL